MQMFAQLIVDGTIVQQTTPVDMEPTPALEGEHTTSSSTCKFKFDCDMFVSILNWTILRLIFFDSSPHAHNFWIAILRQAQGIRLVGSIEISQEEALLLGEKRGGVSTIHVVNHHLRLCSFVPTPCESEP